MTITPTKENLEILTNFFEQKKEGENEFVFSQDKHHEFIKRLFEKAKKQNA